MRPKCMLAILLFIGIILSMLVPSASACSPLPSDYLYLEIIEVKETDLPVGVEVFSRTFRTKYESRHVLPSLRISNETALPITMLGGQTLSELADLEAYQHGMELPQNLENKGIKIAPSRDELLIITEHLLDSPGRPLRLFSYPVFQDKNIRGEMGIQSQPSPQELTIGLNVGGSLYLIPIKVRYTDNPTFKENRRGDSERACKRANAIQFLLSPYSLIGIGMAVGVVILVIWKLRLKYGQIRFE